MNATPGTPTPLLQVLGLSFGHAGQPLLADLSFAIHPGLTLVRGGDGRGKTTLLRLLAGSLQPAAGAIHRPSTPAFHEQPADRAHDATVARAWLAALRPRFAGWDDAVARGLVHAYALTEHIDKPLYMLSTGSRRKLGLVAAAASGASLTLLETPFAALDAASARVLLQCLTDAGHGNRRAWVMADYGLPAGLASVPLAGCVDLGD